MDISKGGVDNVGPDHFILELLNEDMTKWIAHADKQWDGHRFHYYAKKFNFLEDAMLHGKALNMEFRVVEITYHYGDFIMPRYLLKLKDNAGFQVKGVKGLDARATYKNEAEFLAGNPKVEDLNPIGKQLIGAKDWKDQQDPKVAAKLCWAAISKLTIKEPNEKAPRTKMSYEFKVGDPTKWAKAPMQVRTILDKFRELKVQRIDTDKISEILAGLIKEGKLVTKQDPMRVFHYYVTDKKRGFKVYDTLV